MVGMVAHPSTVRYETSRYSATMNAAAPRVGGDSSAPTPAAARMPPAFSAGYPARRRIGHVTAPTVTAVAVPDRPVLRQQSAVVSVAEKQRAHHRKCPSSGASARLEHEYQQHRSRGDVDRVQQALAIQEGVVAAATRSDRDRQD